MQIYHTWLHKDLRLPHLIILLGALSVPVLMGVPSALPVLCMLELCLLPANVLRVPESLAHWSFLPLIGAGAAKHCSTLYPAMHCGLQSMGFALLEFEHGPSLHKSFRVQVWCSSACWTPFRCGPADQDGIGQCSSSSHALISNNKAEITTCSLGHACCDCLPRGSDA